uniref:Uncharacterized protein n=1 Tax=Vitis vinifera TaxID=29760 RepID=F6I007_VITVI
MFLIKRSGWEVCTVLIFGMWDFLGCMIIGDGMDTILRLEETFWESSRKGGSRR